MDGLLRNKENISSYKIILKETLNQPWSYVKLLLSFLLTCCNYIFQFLKEFSSATFSIKGYMQQILSPENRVSQWKRESSFLQKRLTAETKRTALRNSVFPSLPDRRSFVCV